MRHYGTTTPSKSPVGIFMSPTPTFTSPSLATSNDNDSYTPIPHNIIENDDFEVPISSNWYHTSSFTNIWLLAGSLLGAVFGIFSAYNYFNTPAYNHLDPYVLTTDSASFTTPPLTTSFFDMFEFYEGGDSKGSAGFQSYVPRETAESVGVAGLRYEDDGHPYITMSTARNSQNRSLPLLSSRLHSLKPLETTSPTLIVISLKSVPTGCGLWPAFWLVNSANEKVWPAEGEIDIVEGVNGITVSKTALHTSAGCDMSGLETPGVMTGSYDTAFGVPDSKTGLPSKIDTYAKNCYVYHPKQWINQGCVIVSDQPNTLGKEFNANGGGVFALEFYPTNDLNGGYIKSWVFRHGQGEIFPDNLERLLEGFAPIPTPDSWGLPYANFPLTKVNCPSTKHFNNLHVIFNTAVCGTVAGQRFKLDCPSEYEEWGSCENYVSNVDWEEVGGGGANEWGVRGLWVYSK